MTMLKNDNDLIPDPSKVQEHLNNYYASLEVIIEPFPELVGGRLPLPHKILH